MVDCMDETTTSWLIRSLQAGESSAFRDLYKRIVPSLYVWAKVRLPHEIQHRFDAEDLVQETWCRALARISTFDPERGSFRAWVFGIATKTCAEELRRLHRRRVERVESPEELPADVSTVTQRVARMDELRRLLQRIDKLDALSRDILLYRGLEGLPYRELSERLGLSVEACEIRWRRLRKQLRDELLPKGLLEP